MGTIGLPVTGGHRVVAELQPAMTYIDAPVSGTKAPAEKAQIPGARQRRSGKGAAAEPVFALSPAGTQWFGDNSQKMKLVLNAWLISMMQWASRRAPSWRRRWLHPDQLWSALKAARWRRYVKVKLTPSPAKQLPQMQLAHALKMPGRRFPGWPHTMPGLEKHRRT